MKTLTQTEIDAVDGGSVLILLVPEAVLAAAAEAAAELGKNSN